MIISQEFTEVMKEYLRKGFVSGWKLRYYRNKVGILEVKTINTDNATTNIQQFSINVWSEFNFLWKSLEVHMRVNKIITYFEQSHVL